MIPAVITGSHVVHLLYEPARSGISRHVLSLVRDLPDLRHTVLLPTGLDGVAAEARALGATAREVPMPSRVLPASALWALPRALRAADGDLVHLHSLEAGGFGSLAATLAGSRRVVFTPQTLELRRPRLLPPFLVALRAAARGHRAWIAVSHGQERALAAAAPRGVAVRRVPNAVPALRPLPDRVEARARLGWPPAALVVACIGRLSAQKDPLTFVRAARDLRDVVAVLVGAGPLRREVEAAAAGAAHVRVAGHVPAIEDVLAASDVVVLASRWEGLPYALLEAMSSGVPVVATAIDGNVDLVHHERTGLLVQPGDPAALGRAIARLASDGALRRRLADAARAHVAASFSPEAVAARLRAVYAEALGA